MNEDLKNFASDLKHLREKSNFTLQNIYQKTRIDIKFLEAIEEGNFDVIESVYVRAFIKSYANSIGLDPEETLKNFDLAREEKLYTLDKDQTETENESNESQKKVFSSGPEPVRENRFPDYRQQKYIAPVSIFVFIIVIISIYFIFIKDDSNNIVRETPFNEVLAEKEIDSAENQNNVQERFEVLAEDTSRALPEVRAESKTEVKLLANDTTWIRVTRNDTEEEEFILIPGNTKTYDAADDIKILIGNAGGLNIFLNDSLLELHSKKGEIKYVGINEKGLTFLRLPEKNTDAQQD
jgi:cytoskeletal protein RodZ